KDVGDSAVVALDAQDATRRVLLGGLDVFDAHTERAGELLAGRRVAELRGELVGSAGHLAQPGAGAARRPVHGAQLVDERTADADGRVPVERDARRGVVGVRSLDESEGAGGGEVVAA